MPEKSVEHINMYASFWVKYMEQLMHSLISVPIESLVRERS